MTKDSLAKAKLPDEPGVYFFKKGRKILYIGKAASLRDRVRSYFSTDLAESRSPAIVKMVEEADRLSYQKTDSVLEALILEANLIKRHMPPYNVMEKDNKSFNYLVITKEEFPKVLVMRGRELYTDWDQKDIKHLFGPFPAGLALQDAVKIVRRIFPFRDSKCFPCGTPRNEACKPCFNRQIGLCPGVCTGEMTADEYQGVIRNISELFAGNFHGLKRRLASAMRAAAQAERFEEAALLRRQVDALQHVRDVSLIKRESRVSSGGPPGSYLAGGRIEAFDVAHTSGQETVAVMTVVQGGEPLKAAYRKFKIKSVTNNDVAALKEALSRRLGHPEWPLPRLFVVDGALAQMRTAERVLAQAGLMIPVVGVVKDEHHAPRDIKGEARLIASYERDIILANSEAHRFAIAFHRRRRQHRSLNI